MADPPPSRPATADDLAACEERLSVYTSVFFDERLHATERRLLARLDSQTRLLLVALAGIAVVLALVLLAAPAR